MLEHHNTQGIWVGSMSLHGYGTVLDYQCGMLTTRLTDGTNVSGPPELFRTDEGESGDRALERIFVPPRVEVLRYGAIREALASLRSVSLYGYQDTRSWDNRTQYVFSDEGSYGVVHFLDSDCFAAIVCADPFRDYDLSSSKKQIPTELHEAGNIVCSLPLFMSPDNREISAIFWSKEGNIESSEPWPAVYKYGGELLRREFLSNELWLQEAMYYYELDSSIAMDIMNISKRLMCDDEIVIDGSMLDLLVVPQSQHRNEAVAMLTQMGVVVE